MRAVADATVLIYLAKLNRLDLLGDLFDEVLVPREVWGEVVERGKAERYADAHRVEDAVGEALSVIDDPGPEATELPAPSGLGRGEAAAIGAAEDARALTDDHAARVTARSLGVEVGGTIYVLLESLERGHIDHERYVSLLDELTESGFRISASLYRKALEAGEEIAEGP